MCVARRVEFVVRDRGSFNTFVLDIECMLRMATHTQATHTLCTAPALIIPCDPFISVITALMRV